MQDLQGKIVRAIDVGYGNTKFTMFHNHGQEIVCASFPSIAPQAAVGPDLSGGVFQKRNTFTIEVDGVRYEVGKDADLARDASYGRILDPAYSLTDTYLALVRGAIAYMGVPHIDVLMLGLPVNTFEQYNQKVAERIRGEHMIPDANGQQRPVQVHEVRVIAQPIGGFFDHSIRNGIYRRMRDQINLLIDPGYYTLDWVVAHGIKMINARSGAHSGGMSAVLGSMAESIGHELKTQISDVTAIDNAIRTNTNPRFYGREYEINRFVEIGKAKARQFVAVLANKVGNAVDIDNIILVGGGAQFFRDVIQEKFPNHELSIATEAEYANVRGFQLLGEQHAASSAFNARRSGVPA